MVRRTLVLVFLLFGACSTRTGGVAPDVAADPGSGATTASNRPQAFAAAVHRYDKGDLAEAEPLFRSALESHPQLADHCLRHLARIAETGGDLDGAVALWTELLERTADSVWRGEAAAAIARSRFRAGDLGGAVSWLAQAERSATDDSTRAAVLWLSAELGRARGDAAKAWALGNRVRSQYPASREATLARQVAARDRPLAALATVASALEDARLLSSEGEIASALDLVREAKRRFPHHPDFPELLFLEARTLGQAGDAVAASRVVEEIDRSHPRHPTAARALYRRASTAWNRDEDLPALALFGEYLDRFPRAESAAESLYAIGRIHAEAGRFAEASRQFSELRRRYPASDLAAEADWQAAWSEYRGGRFSSAARRFGETAARGGKEAAAALYWRGRALERTGRPARDVYQALLGRFPDSYYAMLAEVRLGRRAGVALVGRTARARIHGSLREASNGDPHRLRFDLLRSMDLKGLARLELAHYARHAAGDRRFLLHAWLAVDGYLEALRLASSMGGCDLESPLVSYCYPLGYWTSIRQRSEAAGLDPFLVAALIRQESFFDTRARSPADARGLMQLLPATASRVAAESGRDHLQGVDLYHPHPNLELGTAYLRRLIDSYGGNLTRALAAYNAGEAAVEKWQRRHPGIPDDEFVENLSYRETRNYVKRVLGLWRVYRALYADLARGLSARVQVPPIDVRQPPSPHPSPAKRLSARAGTSD